VRGRRWLLLLAAIAAAIFLRFLASFPWRQTADILAAADVTQLGVAAGLNLLSLAAKAWAWQLVLQPAARVRWRTAQAAVFAGAAVGSVSIGATGEAVRLRLLGVREGVGTAAALRSLVTSRLVEAAALGIVLAAAVVTLAPPGAHRLALASAVLIAGAAAALRWVPWLRADTRLAAPLAIDIGGWLCQWGTYHWAVAAAGAAVTPRLSVLALVLSNVGGIFRLTPGNLGVAPAAVILALRPAGIPLAAALAGGLALQAVQVLPVLAIGLGLLGRHRMRAPATAR
jgi:uncharacterized membrane protein YbhN (UPF0104 family)